VECVKGRGAADDDDPFNFFDIEDIPSGEELNGRELKGLRLIASSENPLEAMLILMGGGPKDRASLGLGVRASCPETTKLMSDGQLYKFIDNRIGELARQGKIRQIERGLWGIA
jgi:hypothetical protein